MSKSQGEKQTATAARPTPPEAQTEAPDGVHVVADGDTLDSIAESTRVDAARLQRLNAIKKPEHIWPGMTIRTK